MRSIAAFAAAAALISSSAQAASLFTYPLGRVPVESDGRRFMIVVHGKEDAFLIQATQGAAWGGKRPQDWPPEVWRKAAEAFASPVGCGIPEVRAITRQGATWEATYVCPEGVDLRALFTAQKDDLRKGLPLHR